MSDGFSSSETKGLNSLEKEIEYRLGRMRLDVFTKDFAPPGVEEVVSGQDVAHSSRPYAQAHDDSPAHSEKGFVRGAAAGDAKDQAPVDALDVEEQKYQAEIKRPKSQFPMSLDKRVEQRMK